MAIELESTKGLAFVTLEIWIFVHRLLFQEAAQW